MIRVIAILICFALPTWGLNPGPHEKIEERAKKYSENLENKKRKKARLPPSLLAFVSIANEDKEGIYNVVEIGKRAPILFAAFKTLNDSSEMDAVTKMKGAFSQAELASLQAMRTIAKDKLLPLLKKMSGLCDAEDKCPQGFNDKLKSLVESLDERKVAPSQKDDESKKDDPAPPQGDSDPDTTPEDPAATKENPGDGKQPRLTDDEDPNLNRDQDSENADNDFTPQVTPEEDPGISASPGSGSSAGGGQQQSPQSPPGGSGGGAQYQKNQSKINESKVPDPKGVEPLEPFGVVKDVDMSEWSSKLGAPQFGPQDFSAVSALESQIANLTSTRLGAFSSRILEDGYLTINQRRLPDPMSLRAVTAPRYSISQALAAGGRTRNSRLSRSQRTPSSFGIPSRSLASSSRMLNVKRRKGQAENSAVSMALRAAKGRRFLNPKTVRNID